jgi:hypothetical protein
MNHWQKQAGGAHRGRFWPSAARSEPDWQIADLPTGQLMLQLPQSLAWLQDAPEPLVVVIDR